jgi:hypothetical protein
VLTYLAPTEKKNPAVYVIAQCKTWHIQCYILGNVENKSTPIQPSTADTVVIWKFKELLVAIKPANSFYSQKCLPLNKCGFQNTVYISCALYQTSKQNF